jgi:hypothetical protein
MYGLNKSASFRPHLADVERDEKARQGKSNDKHAQGAKLREKLQEKLDNALDRALEDSFPGSDPISVTQPPQSVYDKHDRQTR